MRKIVVNTFITLDGIMQAPGGPEEDPTGGFKYGGWSVNYWDEMMAKVIMDEVMAKPFDLLLGRKTYDIFAAHWPFVKNDPDKLDREMLDCSVPLGALANWMTWTNGVSPSAAEISDFSTKVGN